MGIFLTSASTKKKKTEDINTAKVDHDLIKIHPANWDYGRKIVIIEALGEI